MSNRREYSGRTTGESTYLTPTTPTIGESTYLESTTPATESTGTILRPPGGYQLAEQPPEDPYSDEMKHAMLSNQDQPRSAEVELEPGVTVAAGIRNLYFNFGGLVAVVSAHWQTPENFER